MVDAPVASLDELTLAHDPSYVDAVVNGRVPADMQRRIGFPWSSQMVERSRRSVGATIAAAHAALFLRECRHCADLIELHNDRLSLVAAGGSVAGVAGDEGGGGANQQRQNDPQTSGLAQRG